MSVARTVIIAALTLAVMCLGLNVAQANCYCVNPAFFHVAYHHPHCGRPTTRATFTTLHARQKMQHCVFLASYTVETLTPKPTKTSVVVSPTSVPTSTPLPVYPTAVPTAVPTSVPTDTQHQILDLINNDRAQYGRPALTLIADATTQQHAVDMASIGTLFHQSAQFPNESFPYPYDNIFGGENAGAGDITQVNTGMMAELGNPPNPAMCATVISHACNIINPAFTKVAIGVATGPPYGTFQVQDFR